MKTTLSLLASLTLFAPLPAAEAEVTSFLADHCVKCHGPTKQAGGLRLDDLLAPAAGANVDPRWQVVRDQLRDGLMPPPKEPQLDAAKVRAVIADITSLAKLPAARLPNQGNLIPHEVLFGTPAPVGVGASPERAWRLSPESYRGFVRDLTRKNELPGLSMPFNLTADRGIRDYAGLYSVDVPTTETLLRNAALIVDSQCGLLGKNDNVREFVALMTATSPPTTSQIVTAIQLQFKMALGRAATKDELARYVSLYEKSANASDAKTAVKTMLQAVILRSDALFRSEWTGESGRRMLPPLELAKAISLTLGNRRDANLVEAAESGQLKTREDVTREVTKLFADPKADTSRLLQFIHEYFEYEKADEVFKDKPKSFMFSARNLVEDTDHLVMHILAEDRDVFRRLLTTDETFMNATLRQNKKLGKKEIQRAQVPNANNNKGQAPPEAMYGFTDWPSPQPAKLAPETRIGILMQPSWLAAWSTNFDNDPVRRGRWIRERLLGGNVPDIPIGVAAQVPDEPHRIFRDRLQITHQEYCWKCHRRMDDLGLPFEQFDHYGRFRTLEPVLDVEATAKNVDKKGQSLGKVYTEVPLNTTGLINESGDPSLDGNVKDPREMIRKLANSDRCRQVFIRHAFRFFLGRNETFSDARALQDADRAYVESGGSFKALVTSLLTSDPFLYRIATGEPK